MRDGLESEDGAWMFAEPINLSPERDWLKLAPARMLSVTAEESKQLIAALNQHFPELGLHFHNSHPDRWYVSCAEKEIPVTTPAYAASLGPLIECQPKSKGSINWRSLQNETQMLFHNHRVNQQREAEGKPTINGVWFWGGGAMPQLNRPSIDCLLSDIPFALELAKQTNLVAKSPTSLDFQELDGNVLIAIDDLANLISDYDLPRWAAAIERIDQSLFNPILTALSRGTISHLIIRASYGDWEQAFSITKRDLLLRFLRPSKPLSSYA